MASSKNKLSAVDAIIAEAADLVALEQIAALNTAHLSEESSLPSNLESRFRKLKSFPTSTTTPTPTKRRSSLDRSESAPPSTNPAAAKKPQENAAPTIQEEADFQKQPSPPPPRAATSLGIQDEEEGEAKFSSEPPAKQESRSGGFPTSFSPTLRERNRDRDSPSPPRQACCFGFSPKKALHRIPSKAKEKGSHEGDLDLLGVGDVGEWGDENRRIVTELKQQQRKLKKALREQEKVSKETAKMAHWVKQASARMTHTAAIDDLLSDHDDDDELK